MTDASAYDWNIRIDVGGVTFTGPGMETRDEAEAVASIVERDSGVDVGVFRQ